jgi:hypothetical protein
VPRLLSKFGSYTILLSHPADPVAGAGAIAAEKLFTPLDSRTRTAWLVAGSMREKPLARL